MSENELQFCEPSFTTLRTGDILPEGFEPDTAFWCCGQYWRDDATRETIKMCAWPNTLKELGYKQMFDQFLIFVEAENSEGDA